MKGAPPARAAQPAILGAFVLALALAFAPTSGAADDPAAGRRAGIDLEVRPDCNRNGIPDSLDIARGVADDLDRDGVIDDCLRPVDVERFVAGSLLRPEARDRRAQHLLVRYRPHYGLEVLYATRGEATLDRVTVLARGGKPWRSVSHFEGAGVHRIMVPTAELGLPSDTQGSGVVRLDLGKRAYTMPVAWDWESLPEPSPSSP